MNDIARLAEIDLMTVFLGAFAILAAIKAAVSLLEWLSGKLGIETGWMRRRRDEHALLINTSEGLSVLREQHEESVRQSNYQDEMIKDSILSLAHTVDGIADTLKDMQEKENATRLKELRGSLIRCYNKYREIGSWSKLERDAFWDLFDDYEKRGGDGYIHSIVEPAMREMKEID